MNLSLLKDIFAVEFLKKRNDSVASRWSRILVSKIILVIVIITSWFWSKGKMNCLKSEEGPYPEFVTKSCWMKGLFLYKGLMAEPRLSRKFGIPDNIGNDHIQNNPLMSRCTEPGCKKMTRVYFSSYQWVLFLFLSFSFFLQMPYLVFRQGLRRNLQITNYTARDIYELWFSQGKGYGPMSCISQSLYSSIHVMIEVCYVIVNVIIFKACKKIFISFSQRDIYRLFPTVGVCMIYEKKRELLVSMTNNHLYLCEMSLHVIYGHCLMIVWSVVVSNMIVSPIVALVSVCRFCQKKFLSRRKGLTLNQLEAVPRT